MRAQEKMGHSSMSEGWRDHTSPAQERVNWVMDEVMSGRMSQADGMVEMEKANLGSFVRTGWLGRTLGLTSPSGPTLMVAVLTAPFFGPALYRSSGVIAAVM